MKKSPKAFKFQSLSRGALALVIVALSSVQAQAATYTFNGTTSGTYDWALPSTNWSGTPVSNLDTTLAYSGTLAVSAAIVSNNNIGSPPFRLNSLTFANAGTTTAGTITLQGGQLEFVTNSSAVTPTLSANLGAIPPAITINNNLLLTNNLGVSGSSNLTIGGVITGSGKLTKTGAGTLTLIGDNTSYTGGVDIEGGIVRGTVNNKWLGADSNVITLGASSGSAAASLRFGNTMGTIANPIVVRAGSSGALTIESTDGGFAGYAVTLTGPITLNNNLNLTQDGNNRTMTVQGVITGSSTITTRSNNLAGGQDGMLINGANSTSFTGNVVIAKRNLSFTQNALGGPTSTGTIAFTGSDSALTWSGANTQDLSSRIRIENGITASISTGTNNVTFANAIGNNLAGSASTGGIGKYGTGTLTLAATNTYTGSTSVFGGVLQPNTPGALPGFNTSGKVVFSGGTLSVPVWASGWTTGEVDTLLSNATKTSGSLGLDTTNGDLVQWTPFTNAVSSFGPALGLNKLGTGNLTLNSSNTYVGPTAVNGGTLVLASGASLTSSGVTLTNAGSTLAVTPGAAGTTTLGGTLTLNSGTVFTMADGATSTASLTGAATLAPASGAGIVSPTMNFNIGGVTTATDVLAIGGAATVGTARAGVGFTGFGSTALTLGSYNFITAGSGLTPANFTLLSPNVLVNGTVYNLALSGTATTETVTVASGAVSVPTAHWTGSQGNGNWNALTGGTTANFSSDAGGLFNTFILPNSNTNVIFTANSATNLSTALNQNFTINSLTFSGTGTSNTAGSTIAHGTGTNALTINAAALHGNTLGNGITVNAGSGANTISSNVALGAAQTWTNNSANALTVSGNISGGFGLTTTGTGGLILSGSNSHTGATTLTTTTTLRAVANGGNTISGVSSALSPSSVLTFAPSATGNIPVLELRANDTTAFNTAGVAFTATTSARTIAIDVANAGSGTGKQLTLGGTLTITGASGAGVATVNVTGSNGYSLALGGVTNSGTTTGTTNFHVTTADLSIASLNGTTASFTYGFTGSGNTTITGDLTRATTSRSLTLNQSGLGSLTLLGSASSGSSNLQGYTFNLSAGTLNLNNANAMGTIAPRVLNISGGTLDNTSGGSITMAGLPALFLTGDFTFGATRALNMGTGIASLGNAAGTRTITTNGTTNALTLGNVTETASGLALAKAGTGTLNLSGPAFHTGGTTVNNGTLEVNGAAVAALSSETGTFVAVNLTNNSHFTITVPNTANIRVGQVITGTNIAPGTVVREVLSGTTLRLSQGTLAAGTFNDLTYSAGGGLGTGAVAINGGTLLVNSTGNINSVSGVTVNTGGNFRYNSSTAYTAPLTVAGGTVSGSGTLNVDLALNNIADTLSPGNSPGILPLGVSQNWSAFTYDWEINDWTGGIAGTDFDQITIAGSLTLNNANLYEINVLSLLAGNTSGDVFNFAETGQSWTVLTTTGGITGFNGSNWAVDVSGFTNAETGAFTLTQAGNNLVLSYGVIPEPSTYAMLLGGLAMLALLRRRSKS
jgi:fibronectin-binding autotransporter adhesin